MDLYGRYIEFEVRYRGRERSLKLAIDDSTEDKAVSKHLISINDWIDSNVYDIIGIDTASLDRIAAKRSESAEAKSRPFSYLANFISGKDAKAAIVSACKGNDKHVPIARSYLIGRMLSNMGVLR
ncbi:MAG: DUF2666 family protein [Candidatus Marsarchaeota archaeon]|nr:DUF2666 family protein [Candidatus Marsarchaeota archaeon]